MAAQIRGNVHLKPAIFLRMILIVPIVGIIRGRGRRGPDAETMGCEGTEQYKQNKDNDSYDILFVSQVFCYVFDHGKLLVAMSAMHKDTMMRSYS